MTEPNVIYKNKDFLVVDKPAGLLVHSARVNGARKKDEKKVPTLTDWLLKHYPQVKTVGDDPAERPGIVHRLDKETSGVMLVALNQRSFEYLKSLFMGHAIAKTYRAIVYGKPKKSEGIINMPIGIKNGTLKRSVRSPRMAKEAVTSYKVLKTWDAPSADGKERPFSLLEVAPKTGRTHQIRVHLTSIGNPIVGDPLYGPKKMPPWADRLMLHALRVAFPDRKGRTLRFEAKCLFCGPRIRD